MPYVLPSDPSSVGVPPVPPDLPGWSDLLPPRCPRCPPPPSTPGRPSESGKISVEWVLSYLDNLIQLKSNFWESSRKWDRSSIILLTSPHISPDEVGDGEECFPSLLGNEGEGLNSAFRGHFYKSAVQANCDTNRVQTNKFKTDNSEYFLSRATVVISSLVVGVWWSTKYQDPEISRLRKMM